MKDEADVIFTHGSVITVDPSDRLCEAVAVSGTRIAAVGSSREVEKWKGSATRVVDLQGRSLLPGFIDAHCHPGYYGATKMQIRCGLPEVLSIEGLKLEIQRRAAHLPPGSWILGRGYDQHQLAEKRHPTRWDFDEVAPNHRVFITRVCGHMSVANSLVLAEFGITRDTPDPHGGKIARDSRGEPTGLLLEHAHIPIRMSTQPSYADLEKGMKLMNQDFLSRGITSAQDASGRNLDEIRLFQRGVQESWLQVRIYFMVRTSGTTIQVGESYLQSGLVTGFGNERLRLGAYKLQMDGAGSGGSAAMREAYPGDRSNFGILHMTQEELDELVMKGHKAGYQVGVHAIGDRAIEMTLESFRKALRQCPRENHRHRIEHCGILDDSLMDQMKELGVIPALGIPFLYELGDSYVRSYGLDRLNGAYPLRSLIGKGIITAMSSDAPVIDPNPMHGIYFATTRKTPSGQAIAPEEAVGLLQAIRAYTAYGAYASFEENLKGSIEIGKLADLVVLSRNILQIPREEILKIKVDLTMIDGQVVFNRE